MRPQDRSSARSRLKRRAFPIHAYVGPNGHGKSWAMVYDTLPSLDHGRPVLSTVRLLDFRNPRPCDDETCDYPSHPDHQAAHPLYVPFRDYQQLLEWRDGDVLMDEVTGVASSRETSSMPVQVANFLVQLRRRNVALRWTAPAWGRADKIIREVTQAATLCRGSMARKAPQVEGQPPHLWTSKNVFTLQTYDSMLMDEFEAHRAEHIPHAVWGVYFRPGAFAEIAYDTLDAVTALGWANDAGLCMVCGGKRLHPKCGCVDHGHKATTPREWSAATEPGASPLPAPAPAPVLLPVAARVATGARAPRSTPLPA